MDIPYSADARPDTGFTNARLGIWLFLASEAMLFASLVSAYVLLRAGADFWPRQSDYMNLRLALLNTGLLLASSVTMRLAGRSLREGVPAAFRVHMGLTVLGGIGFLLLKSLEWGEKFAHHYYPSTSNFLGMYFALTGVHIAHVAGGVMVNAALLVMSARWWRTRPAVLANRVEVAGLYWYFVDAMWLAIFVLLYLLP